MYVVCGLTAAGSNVVAFNLIHSVFDVRTLIANLLSFGVGAVVSIYLHNRFSFGDRKEANRCMFVLGLLIAVCIVSGMTIALEQTRLYRWFINFLTICVGGAFTSSWNNKFVWPK